MFILLGYILISFVFGFLISSSATPVVGVFISGSLGLVAAVVGTQYFTVEDRKACASGVGQGLAVVSIGLMLGVFGGYHARTYTFDQTAVRFNDLPWGMHRAPLSTKEALDWIRIKDQMMRMGYARQQVVALYQIRLNEVDRLLREIEENEKQGRKASRFTMREIYEPDSLYPVLIRDYTVDISRNIVQSHEVPPSD